MKLGVFPKFSERENQYEKLCNGSVGLCPQIFPWCRPADRLNAILEKRLKRLACNSHMHRQAFARPPNIGQGSPSHTQSECFCPGSPEKEATRCFVLVFFDFMGILHFTVVLEGKINIERHALEVWAYAFTSRPGPWERNIHLIRATKFIFKPLC